MTVHSQVSTSEHRQHNGGSLLSIRDLSVQFRTDLGIVTVVDGVDLSIADGQTVGLVGESGSGKTVTALSILGLLPKRTARVVSGEIEFRGTDLASASTNRLRQIRGNEIAMIFQEPMSSLNPAFTIGDQIVEVVLEHRAMSRRQAWLRAEEMLDIVGIPSARRRARDYPHSFSGGMRQRAMIAMALACEPALLVADEPTTALDVTVQARILELLRSLQSEFGMAILLVTHDLGVVADLCDEVVVMYAGQVVERAASRQLFDRPQHPYTEGLLMSMPQVGDSGALHSITGVAPPPWDWPDGCRFHPRCGYSQPHRCTDEPIALTGRDGPSTRCVRIDELELRGTE